MSEISSDLFCKGYSTPKASKEAKYVGTASISCHAGAKCSCRIVNELDSRDLGKLECDEGSEHVYMKLDSIPFVNRDACLAALEQHHQDVFDQLLPPTSQNVLPATSGTSAQTCQSQSASVAGLEQVTKQQLLTIDQAEKLLQYFSENGRFFPFVVLPQDATVKSLSRKSPFLLLAILTAASAADIQLNYQLDHEFKRVLSQRVILEGQKSLDYLQGLLVYNAWFVFQRLYFLVANPK